VLNKLIRLAAEKEAASGQQTIAFTAETEHPYKNNARQEWEIAAPEGHSALAFVFDKFETERDTDILTITDADSGAVLGNLSGRLPNGYTSQIYGAKHIKLTFTSDSRYAMNGFNLVRAIAYKQMEYTFSREDARRAVMEVAQVPRWLIDRDFRVIADLKGKLDADVVGVAEGKRDLVRLAKNGYISGRTDEKPIATAMLAGPTGTGKSYIAKRMADFLEMKLITFDMTSYKDASTFPVFQESLARALTNNPYAVYLFEEIDKASIEVLDQLYFMTDEGVFFDRTQRPIFARGAFILMTTNAASDVILHDPNNPNLRDIVMADLKKHFRPSFLNRFDAISIFKPFTDAEYLQLATTLVRKKIKNVREQLAWGLSVDEGTIQFISINGRSPEFGARPMERMVESTIGIGIAEYQLKFGALLDDAVIQIAKLQGNRDFRITVAGGQALDYRVDDTNGMGFEPFFFKRAGRLQTPLRTTNEFALDLHKFFNRVRLYTPHD
jgi:ATP-dependent Clp protease ATP-binding subunit ClpA